MIPLPGSESQASGHSVNPTGVAHNTLRKQGTLPLTAPTGQRAQRQTPSVREQLKVHEPVVEDEATPSATESQTQDQLRETVSKEALLRAWKRYADEHFSEGLRSLYATLIAEEPVIDASTDTIGFKIHNTVQERDLNEIRTDLLDFLRKTLRNYFLQLQIERIQEEEVKKEFLSEREKYNRLVAKNPLLDELRKQLDLDLRD